MLGRSKFDAQGLPAFIFAAVSLVFGVLTWRDIPFVGTIVSIVCGHDARSDMKRLTTPWSVVSNPMTIIGFALGYAKVLDGSLFMLALLSLALFGEMFSHL